MRQVVHNITIFSKYFYSTGDPSPFLYFEERKVGVTIFMFKDLFIPYHSVSECGFQVPKTYQAAAHIWGLPR